MRILAILLTLALSTSVFSSTTDEAASLYSKRGLDSQGLENAKASAEMYKAIIAESHDISDVQKATLLVNQSEALYFVGLVLQKDGDDKGALKVFWEGYEVGLAAVNLLGNNPGDKETPVNPKVLANKEQLGTSMYWELVNILRWGKIYGVFQALSKWKEIGKPRIEDILRLNPTAVEYGVNRSAGKALLTLPGNQKIQGKSGLDFLREAYEATPSKEVKGVVLSTNMATVTFYLEALREDKDAETFCPIFSNLKDFMHEVTDAELGEMFPKLVPEARFEYGDFMKEKKNQRFYDSKCE